MLIYLLRRLLLAASVMLVAVSLLFCLVFLVPGDPASVALGPRASEAQKQVLRVTMGLDQPAPVQIGRFLARVVRGDLGEDVLVLPSLTVALGWIGYLSRLVRASMLEVLKENHICTFRAFGMPDRLIALRYALPIAVVSVLGVGIGSLLSGAVLTEIVFARPGLGKLAFDSVISRNFPVVMGTVVVTSGLYVLANLIADVINTCLDPRVRQEL